MKVTRLFWWGGGNNVDILIATVSRRRLAQGSRSPAVRSGARQSRVGARPLFRRLDHNIAASAPASIVHALPAMSPSRRPPLP